MVDLTQAAVERIRVLFPDAQQEVVDLLRRDCADNLPLWKPTTPEALDRIRFAVLKLSGGRLDRLRKAIRQAQVDWRDVLMAAGFGESLTANVNWMPSGADTGQQR